METIDKEVKAPKKPYDAKNVTSTRGFKRNNTWPAKNLKFLVEDKSEEKKEGLGLSNEAELVSLYSQGSRLGFLDMYMRMHKLTQRKVAAELGKSPGTVSYWFRTDDIYIANLKEFADAFGARLVVEFIEG